MWNSYNSFKGWIVPSQNSYVEALTHSAPKCVYIGDSDFKEVIKIKMRSYEQA